VAQKFADVGAIYGKTSVQVAIAWVLAQSNIACALTGPSTIGHLEENIGGSGWNFETKDLKDLNAFLENEDAWLEQEQKKSIQNILNQSLPLDASRAFKDLVYVIETFIALKFVTEKDVLPVFYELYDIKDNLETLAAKQKMKQIQNQLKGLI
jgi:hypothetical protein